MNNNQPVLVSSTQTSVIGSEVITPFYKSTTATEKPLSKQTPQFIGVTTTPKPIFTPTLNALSQEQFHEKNWKMAFGLNRIRYDGDPTKTGLYIYSSENDQPVNIINVPWRINHLTWSPDGKQIVYSGNGAGFKGAELYMTNDDGTGNKFLTYGDMPSWSPDGKEIVYSEDGNIKKINLASKVKTTLVLAKGFDKLSPVWSPSGKQIAFYTYDETGAEFIKLVKPDGSGQDILNINVTTGWSPFAWSPDSSEIVFRSSEECGDLNIVNLETKTWRVLLSSPDGKMNLSWSPDGNWIAFQRGENHKGICVQAKTVKPESVPWRVGIIDKNGKSLRVLSNTFPLSVEMTSPVWSPVVPLELNKKYIVTVLGDKLLLRDKPSLTASYSKMFAPGAELLTLEGPQMGGKDTWWRVKEVSTGLEGWVREGAGWLRPAGQEE
jgi:dipeptidyl aminopeptidase/acylaminoacyl peptidase